jgi:hypothetical protein
MPQFTPQVFITPMAMFKIHTLVSGINLEIGWLGVAQKDEFGNIYIGDDIYLFEQDVSIGHTEISPDILLDAAEAFLAEEDGMEKANSVLFWGHSHVHAAVEPSQRDLDQMWEFRANQAEYFLGGIFNRYGDVNFMSYDWSGTGIAHYRSPWVIQGDPLPSVEVLSNIRLELLAEIEEKVSYRRAFSTFGKWFSPQDYQSNNNIDDVEDDSGESETPHFEDDSGDTEKGDV